MYFSCLFQSPANTRVSLSWTNFSLGNSRRCLTYDHFIILLGQNSGRFTFACGRYRRSARSSDNTMTLRLNGPMGGGSFTAALSYS